MKENRIFIAFLIMFAYALMIVFGWLGAAFPSWLALTSNLLASFSLVYLLFVPEFFEGRLRIFMYVVLAATAFSLVLRLVGQA